MLGTEIHTFSSLKDLNDFLLDEIDQYRVLHEDYSQWLGSLLRSCEDTHKNEDWYKKSTELQKSLSTQAKKVPATKEKGKKGAGKRAVGKEKPLSLWFGSSQATFVFLLLSKVRLNYSSMQLRKLMPRCRKSRSLN